MSTTDTNTPLINTRDLSVHYPLRGNLFGKKRVVRAIDGIDIQIPKGSFFGLVGESGSGKTTLGRALLKAAPVTRGTAQYNDGEVDYNLVSIDGDDLKEYRKRAQLIFQDPYAALSPRLTVRDIIAEPLEVMNLTGSRDETDERVREIAKRCRLNLEHLRRYPHAFSGGQRQRVAIARALVNNPAIILADEPTGNLDTKTSIEIMEIFEKIHDLGNTIILVTHEPDIADHAQRIIRLRDGLVESDLKNQNVVKASDPTHNYNLR